MLGKIEIEIERNWNKKDKEWAGSAAGYKDELQKLYK